jgi:hypothetical protein
MQVTHGHLSPHHLFLYHSEFARIEDLERIEKHLFLCEDCRTVLESVRNDHPESSVLDLYAVGRLNGPVGNGVKSHLGRCEWCSDTMPLREEKLGKIRLGIDSLLKGAEPKDTEAPGSAAEEFRMPSGPGRDHARDEAREEPETQPEGGQDEENSRTRRPARLLTAYEFYTLGATLAPLAALTPHQSNEQVYRVLMAASVEIEAFLANQELEFGAAEPAGGDLAAELREALALVGGGEREARPAEAVIRRVATALHRLENRLARELGKIDLYRFNSRGTHDLRTLMDHPEAAFDEKTWSLLPGAAQQNWTESARCLVCGFSTAAVFHAVRALEALTAAHLLKLGAPNGDRPLTASLAMLKARGADAGAVNLVEQAAKNPAPFVSDDEALEQFDLTRSAMKALARDMERGSRQRSHWA